MESFHSYPKVHALGHPAVAAVFADDTIYIQEKIDGSQLSFGKDAEGKLFIRSKGQVFDIEAPDKMFTGAAATVKSIAHLLTPGYTYRGEYLQKPKHNALIYDRTPKDFIVLFDVTTGFQNYDPTLLRKEAERLGLEFVGWVEISNWDRDQIDGFVKECMAMPSMLGGKREGIVIKNYSRFGKDGHPLFAKVVSEEFKEVHGASWKESNPNQGDIQQRLRERYTTAARWLKAEQHLKEAGLLSGEPKDIAALVKEVQADFKTECQDAIKEELWAWVEDELARAVVRGLPQWYKDKLAKQALDDLAVESQKLGLYD